MFQVAKMWLAPILVAFLVILFLYLDAKKPKNFPPGIIFHKLCVKQLKNNAKRRSILVASGGMFLRDVTSAQEIRHIVHGDVRPCEEIHRRTDGRPARRQRLPGGAHLC